RKLHFATTRHLRCQQTAETPRTESHHRGWSESARSTFFETGPIWAAIAALRSDRRFGHESRDAGLRAAPPASRRKPRLRISMTLHLRRRSGEFNAKGDD